MMVLNILIFFTSFSLIDSFHIRSSHPSSFYASPFDSDPGIPLFLSPMIYSGQFDLARNLSRVRNLPYSASNLTSFSGFITVNDNYNSNIFFWFFLSQEESEHAPVVMWLQGGPGAPSLFSVFTEHGPFEVNDNLTLQPRKFPWTKNFNMLYVDQPVGTGFSFTNKEEGYARNETDVARDLYNFTIQFFLLFSKFAKNEFFITGESYAGKYVPALAHALLLKPSPLLNFVGIAIGNGWIDPESMNLEYVPLLYRFGMIDKSQAVIFAEFMYQVNRLITQKEWSKANRVSDYVFDGLYSQSVPLFKNFTGCAEYFNQLNCYDEAPPEIYPLLFRDANFRKSLHVGNLPFHNDDTVNLKMDSDIEQSVRKWFERILDSSLQVMLYNGDLDIICGVPLTEAMLQTFEWSDSAQYRVAPKLHWRVDPSDKEIAGYVRHVRNFYQVVVKNAGHMVPTDQPRAAFDLITRFVFHKGF